MNRYDKTGKITMRDIGFDGKTGVAEVMTLFQETVTEHTAFLKLDFPNMIKNYNAKWVIARVRFEIDARLKIGDGYIVSTWPLKAGSARFGRSFVLSGESTAVRAFTEWCVIDADTNAVIRSNVINMPIDEYLTDRVIDGKFSNARETVSDADRVLSRRMCVSDLDINGHVNNVSYIRLALDCFTADELKDINMTSFEMYYVTQCFEGETLTLYKKKAENGYYIEAHSDARTVFRCTVNL